jgi:hypothetical protein
MNNERRVENLSGFNQKYISNYLFSAVEYNDIDEVEKALEAGADVTIKINGDTPLHAAVRVNSPRIIRLLLEYGADSNVKNEDGDTPLHAAVRVESPRIITLLLEYGADRNVKNDDGESALDLADKVCDDCATVMREYFYTNENIQRREEQKRAFEEQKRASNERRRAEKYEAMRRELDESKNLRYLKAKLEELGEGVKNETYYRLAGEYDDMQRAIRDKYRGGKRKYRKTRKGRKTSKKTRKGKRRA